MVAQQQEVGAELAQGVEGVEMEKGRLPPGHRLGLLGEVSLEAPQGV